MGRGRRLAAVWLMAMLAVVVSAPSAAGRGEATRYAEPAGDGPEPCAQADPCPIGVAVNGADAGDVVKALGGTYDLPGGLSISKGVRLKGAKGLNPTILSSAATDAVVSAAPGQVRLIDLAIHHTGTDSGLVLTTEDRAERVRVESSGDEACEPFDNTLLRNTECIATSLQGDGVKPPTSATAEFSLVNVTAIATGANGAGINVVENNTNQHHVVDARNVIAVGGEWDVFADELGGGTAFVDVNLSRSNFDTVFVGEGASVSTPGESHNQAAEPRFVNPDPGILNFHQRRRSPTRDAGGDSPLGLGARDIDRQRRVEGPRVDIGADEFHPG